MATLTDRNWLVGYPSRQGNPTAQITHDFIDALHRLEESDNVDVIADLFADSAQLSNPLVVHSSGEENGTKASCAAYHAALGSASSAFLNGIDDEEKAVLEWRTAIEIDGRPRPTRV